MSVYIIVNIDVTNPEDLKEYQALAGPTMKEHGIGLLGRAKPVEVLEGDAQGGMTVVLRADSEQSARAWYRSPGYTAAIRAREGKARVHMTMVPAV